jgi:hypothetical protein
MHRYAGIQRVGDDVLLKEGKIAGLGLERYARRSGESPQDLYCRCADVRADVDQLIDFESAVAQDPKNSFNFVCIVLPMPADQPADYRVLRTEEIPRAILGFDPQGSDEPRRLVKEPFSLPVSDPDAARSQSVHSIELPVDETP